MQYRTIWGKLSNPKVWETYKNPKGVDDTDSTFTINEVLEENFDVYTVNLSDWLNYHSSEGYSIEKIIQDGDNVLMILGR